MLVVGIALVLQLPLHRSREPLPSLEAYAVEARVVAQLEERDVGEWAEELESRAMPNELSELYERLQVSARAGHDAAVREVLDAFGRQPEATQRKVLEPVPHFFLSRGDLEGTRLAFELLEHVGLGSAYSLLRRWGKEGDEEVIDAWLEERWKRDSSWMPTWLNVRRDHGGADELLAILRDDLRRSPGDLQKLEQVVAAYKLCGSEDDLGAVVVLLEYSKAMENYRAGKLLSARWPTLARPFLERSLSLSMTEGEVAQALRGVSFWSPEFDHRGRESMVRNWVRHELMGVEKRLGNVQRAQQLLEEIERNNPDGLPIAAMLQAGQIQAASGARVIEGRVLDAEVDRSGQSGYWLERASYFEGRKEREEERQAISEALRIASGESPFALAIARSRWGRFLARSGGWAVALDYYVDELRAADKASEGALRLVNAILHAKDDNSEHPDPEDGVYWAYLAARPEWGHNEQRLLSAMLRKFDSSAWGNRSPTADVERVVESREAFWSRAESMAQGGDPSRASMLGSIMARYGELDRGLPLLAGALERMPEGREAQSVATELYAAHSKAGDWRSAEGVEPRTRGYLTPREVVVRRGRLAVCAAKAGATEDALRIWERTSRLDRAFLSPLEELQLLGMGDSLIAFYEELFERDPKCVAARRALASLR